MHIGIHAEFAFVAMRMQNAHSARSSVQLEKRFDGNWRRGNSLPHDYHMLTNWLEIETLQHFCFRVSPPLASTLLSFMTLQWHLVMLGVVCEGTVSHDFHPCPRISIEICLESTSKPSFDAEWTNAHSMSIELMCIQGTCMWTRTKRIQCALEVQCEWALEWSQEECLVNSKQFTEVLSTQNFC